MKKFLSAIILAAVASTAMAQSAIYHRDSSVEWAGGLGTAQGSGPGSYSLFNHNYNNATSFTKHTNWNVNDFTAAGIPFAAANQTSFDPSSPGYGSSSFQMGNGKAASFLNSWGTSNEHGLPMVNADSKMDAAFGGNLKNNHIKNWSMGTNARVCFSTLMKLNYYGGESDAANQNYFSLFLKDTANNVSMNVIVLLWQDRSAPVGEGVAWSEVGQYASSHIGNSTRYVTKQSGSVDTFSGRTNTMAAQGQNKWFHGCITKANLANIISDYNDRVYRRVNIDANVPLDELYNLRYISTNVNDYSIKGAFVQTEMMKLRWDRYWSTIHNAWIESSWYDDGSYAPYNLNARSHVGTTWDYHHIVTLY